MEGRFLEWALLDELTRLDWLEFHGVPKLDRLPELVGSRDVLRVLRLREIRRLVDGSSIARMRGLSELVVVACPKLDLEPLVTAPKLPKLQRVVFAGRKADEQRLSETLPAGVFASYRDAEPEDF